MRESGSIEQDADCVLLMHREKEVDPTNDDIICNVAKNRNGEVRATKLTLYQTNRAFLNPTLKQDYMIRNHFSIKLDYIMLHMMPLEAPKGAKKRFD